jgi:hypothetical protein
MKHLLAAGVVIATLGAVQAAQASIHFTNITDSPLRFQLRCDDDSVTTLWKIEPHATANIFCRNGASMAHLRIDTNHDGEERVVHGLVYDGANYLLGYDGEGDVSFKSIG